MAIDTAAKAASATFLLIPSYAGVITDGTINLDETMAVSWMYNGIAAEEAAVIIALENVISFTSYIDQERNFTSYIDQERNFTSYIDQERNFNLEF